MELINQLTNKSTALEDFRKLMKSRREKITSEHLKAIAQKFGFTSAWVSLMLGLLPLEEKKLKSGDRFTLPDNRHETHVI